MKKECSLCRFFCDPSSAIQLSSIRIGGEADHFCTFVLDTTPRILPNNSYSSKRMIYNIDSLRQLESTDVTISCDELSLNSNASHF